MAVAAAVVASVEVTKAAAVTALIMPATALFLAV